MTSALAVKLIASPLLIAGASLAGKRWGHNVAGLIGGLPLVGGPIVVVLWLEQGEQLARSVALAAPVGIWATITYLLTLGFVSAIAPWYFAIPIAWTCYFASELLLHAAGVAYSIVLGLAVIPGLWIAANHVLPKPRAHAAPAHLPKVELLARIAAAALIVWLLTESTHAIGAEYTGMLAAAPVAASVIPAFTLAISGRDATLLALRGFLTGLIGFAAFFFVLAHTMQFGIVALVPATLAAVAAGLIATKAGSRS
jgi:hypothetical protein